MEPFFMFLDDNIKKGKFILAAKKCDIRIWFIATLLF